MQRKQPNDAKHVTCALHANPSLMPCSCHINLKYPSSAAPEILFTPVAPFPKRVQSLVVGTVEPARDSRIHALQRTINLSTQVQLSIKPQLRTTVAIVFALPIGWSDSIWTLVVQGVKDIIAAAAAVVGNSYSYRIAAKVDAVIGASAGLGVGSNALGKGWRSGGGEGEGRDGGDEVVHSKRHVGWVIGFA